MSALVGYKVTPRLQAIDRSDDIDNWANGGGMYSILPKPKRLPCLVQS